MSVHFGRKRREDLAPADVQTTSFQAEAGCIYPINLSTASGNCVVTFPDPAWLTTIPGATFGVIVTHPHATHRATIGGLSIGDPSSERPEFLTFMLIAGSWRVVNDGRRRHVPA